MIGPMAALAAQRAPASLFPYPAPRIIFITMAPGPAASACAEPEVPATRIETSALTRPNPPRTRPAGASAKRRSDFVAPRAVIRSEARMKKGAAISGKLSRPANTGCIAMSGFSIPCR